MVPLYIIHYGIPFFGALILLEVFFYRRKTLRFPWKEAFVSMLVGIIYAVFNRPISAGIAHVNEFIYQFRIFTIEMNSVWSFVLLFLGEEFAYYWLHRCGHEIRWFWASHSVHHSPMTMTLSGAYRLSFTGAISGLFLFFVPLILLGFSPAAVGAMFGVNLLYQFWIHTECVPRLGWLEFFLNTPSHHRVHHATNHEYIDRNYGGILIIYDRMFGTFCAEKPDEPVIYGRLGKMSTNNIAKLFFEEWLAIYRDVKKTKSWSERWNFVFAHPSWQPAHKLPRSETLAPIVSTPSLKIVSIATPAAELRDTSVSTYPVKKSAVNDYG